MSIKHDVNMKITFYVNRKEVLNILEQGFEGAKDCNDIRSMREYESLYGRVSNLPYKIVGDVSSDKEND